jgi:hypothetical protein
VIVFNSDFVSAWGETSRGFGPQAPCLFSDSCDPGGAKSNSLCPPAGRGGTLNFYTVTYTVAAVTATVGWLWLLAHFAERLLNLN